MELIPEKYRDFQFTKNKQKVKGTGPDLPIAATFISDSLGKEVWCKNKQFENIVRDGISKSVYKVGTGLRLKFRGGHLTVTNSEVLVSLMVSHAYKCGDVRPDPEDPTGFWRQQGVVEFESKPVLIGGTAKQVKPEELDLTKLVPSDEPVVPLVQGG